MYEESLADILPTIIDRESPKTHESPIPTIGQNGALALTPSGSQGRTIWGPLLVTSQISDVQLVQLVARYWIHRGRKKSPKISIDLPLTKP